MNGNQWEEVDADLFIRTNGTCVESTEAIKVCCKEYILTNEEKEYLYNKQPYRLPKLKPYSKISQEPECQLDLKSQTLNVNYSELYLDPLKKMILL